MTNAANINVRITETHIVRVERSISAARGGWTAREVTVRAGEILSGVEERNGYRVEYKGGRAFVFGHRAVAL